MLALVSAFLFAGYTLVYAAVANGGAFAAHPWDGLRADAYQAKRPSFSFGGGILGLGGEILKLIIAPWAGI